MSTSTRNTTHRELSDFLRSRRETTQPATVGLRRSGRRLVKGLRREEVAELAGISTVWYTHLEQGRPVNVSSEVLDRIATVFSLSDEEKQYLFNAAKAARTPAATMVRELPAIIQVLLDTFNGPAAAYNARADLLGLNRLAAKVWSFDRTAAADWPHWNLLWRHYNDAALRTLFDDAEQTAASVVATFRSMHAAHGPDPLYDELLDTMRNSESFMRAWKAPLIGRPAQTEIRIVTPEGTRMAFGSVRVISPAMPGVVIFFHCPTDAGTERALARLNAA